MYLISKVGDIDWSMLNFQLSMVYFPFAGEVNEEEVQRLIMKIEPTDFGSLKCNLCVETFHDEVGARRHLEKSHQVRS